MDVKQQHVSSARILMAEDNKISGMLLSRLLENLGHEVHWAKDGQEALEMATDCRFDLAVVDLHMPRMDGLAFTIKYRSEETCGARLPIIGLTGLDNKEIRQSCYAVGMDEFLLKPVDRQILNVTIQKCLLR
ncbi:MAG: response regulator [Chromatiales bacterium]|nr:response regulator [Chromatiales bacterium]